ncbi:threonine/serine exporter ThrE family protein [Marmoricola sp. URHB0036]|uniref:threonine/serine ThrE exporter family protein n=1 Tax=Marmoricola sp. URHB0036 TaxID=1298863 RepID=UPI0012DF2656|nr:threonine/serine exporter family protein [Marmoricola sp. URHB0036]
MIAPEAAATTPAPPHGSADAERFLVRAISALHANGAETERAERRTGQLARALGLDARAVLGWSWSTFLFKSDAGDYAVRGNDAIPDELALHRVLAVDRIINDLDSGRVDLTDASDRLRGATNMPPTHVGLFTVACVAGGCGLGIIFGVHQATALAFIGVCCALGAVVRRGLGKQGANVYAQAFVAALLAGLCGATLSALGVDSALGLAALCPCLILVPGPHLLKGVLDMATLRIPLGASRLVFASIIMVAVTAGLLTGLWLGQVHLDAAPTGRDVPIWVDVPTAGVLAVAYGVFYGVALRFFYWPFLVGAAAHALRWMVVEHAHANPWVGAGLACLVVGLVLVPVCERWQLPFSALGFASVVSLIPGVLIFRALAGFVQLPSAPANSSQQLLVVTVDCASSAVLIMSVMALGFLVADSIWSHSRVFKAVSRSRSDDDSLRT